MRPRTADGIDDAVLRVLVKRRAIMDANATRVRWGLAQVMEASLMATTEIADAARITVTEARHSLTRLQAQGLAEPVKGWDHDAGRETRAKWTVKPSPEFDPRVKREADMARIDAKHARQDRPVRCADCGTVNRAGDIGSRDKYSRPREKHAAGCRGAPPAFLPKIVVIGDETEWADSPEALAALLARQVDERDVARTQADLRPRRKLGKSYAI